MIVISRFLKRGLFTRGNSEVTNHFDIEIPSNAVAVAAVEEEAGGGGKP